jgi:hypothetical protein
MGIKKLQYAKCRLDGIIATINILGFLTGIECSGHINVPYKTEKRDDETTWLYYKCARCGYIDKFHWVRNNNPVLLDFYKELGK